MEYKDLYQLEEGLHTEFKLAKTKVTLDLLEAMRMDSFLVEFTVHHRFKSSAGRLDL